MPKPSATEALAAGTNPPANKPGQFFTTEHPPPTGYKPGSPFEAPVPTQLFAPDLATAVKYTEERGMGEQVVSLGTAEPPIVLPSEWLDAGNLPQATHAACWLSYVALKAGVATVDELLSDNGILHDLIHLSLPADNFGGGAREIINRIRRLLPDALRALEAKTPGYTRPVPFDVAAHYPNMAND